MEAERLDLSRWDGGDVAAIPVIERRSHNMDFSPKHRALTHKVSQGHSSESWSSCLMSSCAQLVPADPRSFTGPWLSAASVSHNHTSATAAQSQGGECWKLNVS